MEYQIEPIRLSYPELDAGPNPNIMTQRLTRYYVAEETPDDGNFIYLGLNEIEKGPRYKI